MSNTVEVSHISDQNLNLEYVSDKKENNNFTDISQKEIKKDQEKKRVKYCC